MTLFGAVRRATEQLSNGPSAEQVASTLATLCAELQLTSDGSGAASSSNALLLLSRLPHLLSPSDSLAAQLDEWADGARAWAATQRGPASRVDPVECACPPWYVRVARCSV